MKSPWCVWGLLLTVVGAGCAAPPVRAALLPSPKMSTQTIRVQIGEQRNAVRAVNVEEYVRAAIISEFAPPDGDPALVGQMLQVQAVIARTYALANRGRHARQGFDLCSTTHCQLYEPSRLKTSRWAPLAVEAVKRTAGVVLWHGATPASALFHSDCGGHTSTSVAAWGGAVRPYLLAAPDDGPADEAHGSWTYAIETRALQKVLNADPRTRVGAKLDGITVLARDASGRAERLALHGQRERVVKGEEFRAIVARQLGPRAVKSTLFTVRREGRTIVFAGRGFGHGVGLCQVGALARLRAGAAPAEVLRRYYPGTTLRLAP
ncbi:MAG TPA: SpoIID/LytB domain-containing protein [Vicinamibacterales bacterium]|nr:SpoIID/LytB domain-containing protein [Vicinamibacterales bacterium]